MLYRPELLFAATFGFGAMNSRSFNKEFEKAKEELDQRLASKHVRTLNYLQEKSCENDKLRHRISELEGYKMKADYYASLEEHVRSLQVGKSEML